MWHVKQQEDENGIRLYKIKHIVSKQNALHLYHDGFSPWSGRKHCGKQRKCRLRAFSPFPTVFSKAFIRVVKSRNSEVKC